MVDYAIVHYNKTKRRDVEVEKDLFKEKLLAALTKLGQAIKNGTIVDFRDIRDVDGTIIFLHVIGVNGKHSPVVIWMDRAGDDGDVFKAGDR